MTVFEPWAIPLAALIISCAGIAFTWLTLRQTASVAYTQQLERRITHLERELELALQLVRTTREENLDLLRRLLVASGGRREIPH